MGKNNDERNSRSNRKQNRSRGGKRNEGQNKVDRNDRNNERNRNKADNDPRWYNKYPSLVADVARINFFNPLGNHLPLTETEVPGVRRPLAPSMNLAGVCALTYVPTIGYSTDFSSQTNIAARNIYTFVRSANSGAKNYAAQDMMMYLLAMDSLYAFYSWMVRVYGSIGLYTPTNKYLPKALCQAYGVNYANLQAKLSDFRAYINIFGQKIGSLVIPAQTTFAQRHQWMNSNIFLDAATTKGQLYLFNPDGFYVFDDSSNPNGTQLQYLPRTLANCGTLETIIQYGDSLINALVGSEDAQIISGDLLKAFGPAGIFRFQLMPETYTVIPVYSPEVLTQIHNAVVVDHLRRESLDITQDVNTQAIIFTPYAENKVDFLDDPDLGPAMVPSDCDLIDRHIVSMPMDNPTPDQVMVATRLISGSTDVYFNSEESTIRYNLDVIGTEIVNDMAIYYIGEDGQIANFNTNVANIRPTDDPDMGYQVPVWSPSFANYLANFDYHPRWYIPVAVGVQDNDSSMYPTSMHFVRLWTIQNYAAIANYDIKQMHEVALISELTWDNVTNAAKS